MAHWNIDSNMPLRYDSASCVVELIHKQRVLSAFKSGWDIVPAGCLPSAEPKKTSDIPVPARPTKCIKRGDGLRKVPESSVSLINAAQEVIHVDHLRVHLHTIGVYSVCKLWRCGSPSEPVPSARFGAPYEERNANGVQKCKTCFKSHVAKALGAVEHPIVCLEQELPANAEALSEESECESVDSHGNSRP